MDRWEIIVIIVAAIVGIGALFIELIVDPRRDHPYLLSSSIAATAAAIVAWIIFTNYDDEFLDRAHGTGNDLTRNGVFRFVVLLYLVMAVWTLVRLATRRKSHS